MVCLPECGCHRYGKVYMYTLLYMEVRNCLAFGLLYQSVAVRGMARGQFRATTHHRITKALSSIYWNVVFCCLVFEMSAYYH